MAVISLCQKTPDKDHCSAGRNPKQNASGEKAPPQRNLEHLYSIVHNHLSYAMQRANCPISTGRELNKIHCIWTDKPFKQNPQKYIGYGIHSKRLNRPVYKQCQADWLRRLACLYNLGKVNLYHYRIHHKEEAYRNRDRHNRRPVYIQRHAV